MAEDRPAGETPPSTAVATADPPTPDVAPSEAQELKRQSPQLQHAIQVEVRRTIHEEHSYWQGPLPPPEVLAKYNDAFPGCAERIVSNAEKQTTHRQSLERKNQALDFILELLGLVLGFVLAGGMIGGGVWLISEGKGTEGVIAIGTAVAAILGAAWFGRRKKPEQPAQPPSTEPQKDVPAPADQNPIGDRDED